MSILRGYRKHFGLLDISDEKIRGAPPVTTTTNKQLYFVLVNDPTNILYIQFVPPNINIQRNTALQDIKIVGRNNPLYEYTAGEKLLTLQLDFYADEESREDVITKCEWLESLTYNEGHSKPPDLVHLIWGNLFSTQVWAVKTLTYTLSNFYKPKGFLPQQAKVDITLGLDMKKDVVKSDFMQVEKFDGTDYGKTEFI